MKIFFFQSKLNDPGRSRKPTIHSTITVKYLFIWTNLIDRKTRFEDKLETIYPDVDEGRFLKNDLHSDKDHVCLNCFK